MRLGHIIYTVHDLDKAVKEWSDKGFTVEKDPGSLEKEISYLRSVGINGEYMKDLKRTDPKSRLLKYKCFFTYDMSMPFLMSYFETDPKPKNYVHPNGIIRVKKVVYQTTKKNADALQKLVDDNSLEIIIGDPSKIISVEFEEK